MGRQKIIQNPKKLTLYLEEDIRNKAHLLAKANKTSISSLLTGWIIAESVRLAKGRTNSCS